MTVDGERIVSLQARGDRHVDVDLGNVALLPGFVNAHTHLDLCGAHGRCPPTPDFTAWLRQVIAYRRQRSPAEVQQDIAAGIASCLLAGTTLVGDIAVEGASWDLLARSPLRASVYYEMIGLTQPRRTATLRSLSSWLPAHEATETCRPGLSPHAPYSVHRCFFEWVANFSHDANPRLPVAIHLGETAEEIELLEQRSGPFVDFLREAGAWEPEGLVSGVNEVVRMFSRPGNVAFVHANYRREVEVENNPWHTLVLCPRTTAAFGRPLRRGRGSYYALGTDSLASNPDLDILAEARFAYRADPREPSLLLDSLTYSGALALGWADETGSLKAGKSADMVVLPLPLGRSDRDPHELIFDSDLPVQAVMFRGAWVVGAPSS